MVSSCRLEGREMNPTPTPAGQRHAGSNMSNLSDSGFEENLEATRFTREFQEARSELSHWYLQYGDVAFRIQKEKEEQFQTRNCLSNQPQITSAGRCKLISWLIPIRKHFSLSFECFCLTVNIMDRFLACTPVASDCFQLVGVTALLLASKQMEMYSPPIAQLLSLCCNAFSKDQLCNLECIILKRLQYRLTAPTLAFFLGYYSNCCPMVLQSDARHCNDLPQHLCELTLADYTFNQFPASLIAASALVLAAEILQVEEPCCRRSSSLPANQTCRNPQCPVAIKHDLLCMKDFYSSDEMDECQQKLRVLASLNLNTLEFLSSFPHV